ncbi:family 43 glycosylhydrolase [Cryptosporangium minutisporangium]|uniref:Uncharacterized protein n=1 Tax=Cryptosporangium minutisporangium TaxID=113569 RepID=A0ABP6T060_9ACTN
MHREAADPSIVLYRGRFYLFASMSYGFWHSTDLVTWEYRQTDKLPPLDYTPDVREIDGALYISASRRDEPCPFFRSVEPLADDFVEVTPGSFDFWDPNLFQDDDGSTYFYWGCSNKTPVYGTRIDPSTFAPIGERVEVTHSDPAARGWENSGDNHIKQPPRAERDRLIAQYVGDAPFLEAPG